MNNNNHPAKHSETLAAGMARHTLREVATLVDSNMTELRNRLRRRAASPTSTKKGARKLLAYINWHLTPLSVVSMTLDQIREKTTVTAWMLPSILNKQLLLSTYMLEQSKHGIQDLRSTPALLITPHALARMFQRDNFEDLNWMTIRPALAKFTFLLWPSVLAHRELHHTQFALSTDTGMLLGAFDEATTIPVAKTFISPPYSSKWQKLCNVHDHVRVHVASMCEREWSILPGADEATRGAFALRSSALGLATLPVRKSNELMLEGLRNPVFDWLKEPAA